MPVALLLFPVCHGSQGPSICRGLKTQPGGRTVPLLKASQAACSMWRVEVPSAFYHLQTAVTDAVSQGANLAALPWAPEGRRWRRQEIKPSLRSCWRDAKRLYSARGGWHQHPCPAQEVSAHCWCAQFCLGALFAFSAGPDFEGSALSNKMSCCCLLSSSSVLSLLPSITHLLRGLFLWSCIVLFLIIVCIFKELRKGVIPIYIHGNWSHGFWVIKFISRQDCCCTHCPLHTGILFHFESLCLQNTSTEILV